jgi:hypothetical protein
LYGEWGFNGVIVQAIRNNELAIVVLDEAVDRLLELVFTTRLDNQDTPSVDYEVAQAYIQKIDFHPQIFCTI